MYMTSYLNDGAPVAADPAAATAASSAGTPVATVAPSAADAPAPATSATYAIAPKTWLESNWKLVAGIAAASVAICYLKRR